MSCDEKCNKNYCIDNPDENSVCKCTSTGWGDQCVTCPPGHEFPSEGSANCVEMTCDYNCNKDCIGVCKCISTGWGPQCVSCLPG